MSRTIKAIERHMIPPVGLGPESARSNSIVAWDFSLWFALLSPVIGVLLGILGVFLIYH